MTGEPATETGPGREERPDWDGLRRCVPEVLAALLRQHGDFAACEDAVQDALVEAVAAWPRRGWPDRPAAWLTTVARRRLTDRTRNEVARRRREGAEAAGDPGTRAGAQESAPVGEVAATVLADGDDSLALLLLCCHPALTEPSQVALTCRAVAGLTTAQVARAFLVPEATMAQRISRAKQRIREAGGRFEPLDAAERDRRLPAVRSVLYLLFNEGYATTGGDDLIRVDLTAEAIRLTRLLSRLRPDDGETTGLLALMLLHDARRAARTGPAGELIPLDDQDRSRWDGDRIAEGVELITRSLATSALGPYQLQAAIAAVHDEAGSAASTDWPQIAALYGLLERVAPGPVVRLNRIVAVGNVQGAEVGLELLAGLGDDDRAALGYRLDVVRGHLLERRGDMAGAVEALTAAARRTTSRPEQRFLLSRARRLAGGLDSGRS